MNQLKHIFTQETLHCSSISKKSRSLSKKLLEISSFYHIFTSFHSGWGIQFSNKCQPPSNLVKF